MIRKHKGSFILVNHSGTRVMGRHPTRAAAGRQEHAIEMAKEMAKKHRRKM